MRTTLGTACASARSRSRAASEVRVAMPVATTAIAMTAISAAAIPSLRRDSAGAAGSGDIELSRNRSLRGPLAVARVYEAEHDRNKNQRRDSRENEAADHRAAERRVLFAALAQSQRHRQHADDHRQRGHQHRAETHHTCLQRRGSRVTEMLEALAC